MKKIFLTRKTLFLTIILAVVLSTVNGCKKDEGDPPANEVWMQNEAFNPFTLNITVNTTVKWTNKDGMDHTVTSETGLFSSGTIVNNGTFSFQFTTAGTYQYHCTLHAGMEGRIVVN